MKLLPNVTMRDAQEIEMWTEKGEDGRVTWTIRVDGQDHGGGKTMSHAQAFQDCAHYLMDVELLVGENNAA